MVKSFIHAKLIYIYIYKTLKEINQSHKISKMMLFEVLGGNKSNSWEAKNWF